MKFRKIKEIKEIKENQGNHMKMKENQGNQGNHMKINEIIWKSRKIKEIKDLIFIWFPWFPWFPLIFIWFPWFSLIFIDFLDFTCCLRLLYVLGLFELVFNRLDLCWDAWTFMFDVWTHDLKQLQTHHYVTQNDDNNSNELWQGIKRIWWDHNILVLWCHEDRYDNIVTLPCCEIMRRW